MFTKRGTARPSGPASRFSQNFPCFRHYYILPAMSKSVNQNPIIISCKSNTAEITGYTFPPCCFPSDRRPDSDMNLRVSHAYSHFTGPGGNRNISESKVQTPPGVSRGAGVRELQRREKPQQRESSPRWLERPPAPAGTAPLVKDRRGWLPNRPANAKGTIS